MNLTPLNAVVAYDLIWMIEDQKLPKTRKTTYLKFTLKNWKKKHFTLGKI